TPHLGQCVMPSRCARRSTIVRNALPLAVPVREAAIFPPGVPRVYAWGMEFKGLNGTVLFDGEWITIQRKGFVARSTHGGGEVRIPLSGLAAVEWRAPTRVTNGYIAFVPVGSGVNEKRVGMMAIDAAKDPNV